MATPTRQTATTARQATKTITMPPAAEESVPEPVTQRKPADTGRFRLQVDRQTKASYATWEAAEKAGLAIKARRRGDRVEMLVLVRCMSPLMGTFLPCLPRRFDPTVWTGRALQAESDAPVRVEAHAKPAELVRSIARTLVHIILLVGPAGRSLDRPRQDVVTCRRDTRSLHVSRVRPLGHGGADEPGLRLTARGDDRRICPSGPQRDPQWLIKCKHRMGMRGSGTAARSRAAG